MRSCFVFEKVFLERCRSLRIAVLHVHINIEMIPLCLVLHDRHELVIVVKCFVKPETVIKDRPCINITAPKCPGIVQKGAAFHVLAAPFIVFLCSQKSINIPFSFLINSFYVEKGLFL